MRTVLSIDWDFWFRDRPEMDWGHSETPVFIDFLWGMRAAEILVKYDSLGSFQLEGNEWQDFPSWLVERGHVLPEKLGFHLAESHGSAYHAINENLPKGKLEIINVDAHHDVMYNMDPSKGVQCDNWILALAREGRLERLVQVYPAWRANNPEHLDSGVREELMSLGVDYETFVGLDSYFGHKNLKPRKMDLVFFCRSGAWVPPWLDDDFMQSTLAWASWSRRFHVWNRPNIEAFRRNFDMETAERDAERMSHALNRFRKGKHEK